MKMRVRTTNGLTEKIQNQGGSVSRICYQILLIILIFDVVNEEIKKHTK